MASSDQCFCLPFYPGIGRTAFAPSALPKDVNTRRGRGCAPGRGQDRRGHRGCTIRAGRGVSDLHSPQRDENPPAADGALRGAARRAASPAGKGVFRGGESEPAGARMEAGGWRRRWHLPVATPAPPAPPPSPGTDTCCGTAGRPARRRPRPGGRRRIYPAYFPETLNPRSGRAGERLGGGPGPGRAPRGDEQAAPSPGAGGRGRPGLRGAGGSAPQPLGRAGPAAAARGGRAGPGPARRPLLGERSQAAGGGGGSPSLTALDLVALLGGGCVPHGRAGAARGGGEGGAGRMPGRLRRAGAGLGWRGGAARGRGGGWAPRAGSLCLRPPRRRRRALCPPPPPRHTAEMTAGAAPPPCYAARRGRAGRGTPPSTATAAASVCGGGGGRRGSAAARPEGGDCGRLSAPTASRWAAGRRAREGPCSRRPARCPEGPSRPRSAAAGAGARRARAQGDPGRPRGPRPCGCARPAAGARPPPHEHPRRPRDSRPRRAATAARPGPSRPGLRPGSPYEESRTCRLFTNCIYMAQQTIENNKKKKSRKEASCQERLFFPPPPFAATHGINSYSYAFSSGIVTFKLMIALFKYIYLPCERLWVF